MFGRPVKTTLPGRHTRHRFSDVHDHLKHRQKKIKNDHDKHAGEELPPLHVGQKARVLHPDDNTWMPAQVNRVCQESRSRERPLSTVPKRMHFADKQTKAQENKHDHNRTTPIPKPEREDSENIPAQGQVHMHTAHGTDAKQNKTETRMV